MFPLVGEKKAGAESGSAPLSLGFFDADSVGVSGTRTGDAKTGRFDQGPDQKPLVSERRFITVLRFSIAFWLAYAVLVVGDFATPRIIGIVDGTLSTIIPAAAGCFTVWAFRRTTHRLRSSLGTMTVGFFSATLAESYWAARKIFQIQTPSLLIADIAYLVFPVSVAVAVLVLGAPRSSRARARFVLDGVIMAASLLVVSWLTVIQPIYDKGLSSVRDLVVNLAYPISNVIALTVAAIVLSRSVRPPLMTLASGLGFHTVAEMAYAYVQVGGSTVIHLIAVGWMTGMFLIAIAAVQLATTTPFDAVPRSKLPGWSSLLLPYAPLLCTGIVLAAQSRAHIGSPIMIGTGAILVAAVLAREALSLAENRRLIAAEAERATRDPLTGVANQALFKERLADSLRLRSRTRASLAVLILDLDDFKIINDSLGHLAGDALLIAAAGRLSTSVRASDTFARLGGDEFAVLIMGDSDQWVPVAQRVAETFDQPFVIDGREITIKSSMGLAVVDSDSDDSDFTAEEVMRRADIAMYSAKRDRAGGLFTFNAGMVRSPDEQLPKPRQVARTTGGGSGTVRLLSELRRAIGQSELTLVYQPKYDSRTRLLIGVEALLRWPHPELGLLAPEEFLPLVRRHGMIELATDFVIGTALDDAAVWLRRGAHVPVAVNLFPSAISDRDLPGIIAKELAKREFPASSLTVEITEESLLDDMVTSGVVLDELRELGVQIAIDDFGSGYSALSYLAQLPIDEVKLDRNFIALVMDDRRVAAVIGCVIDLSHKLDMRVVAEGVEEESVAVRLRELGCDVLQGFHFSHPLTSSELLSQIL